MTLLRKVANHTLGIRPLVLGDLDGSWILASETCALDIIGARFVRDLKPGEMVVVTTKGIESFFPLEPVKSRFCIFEYVYFARPDSSVEGRNVYEVRKRIGAELAVESPVEADIVVPVYPRVSRDDLYFQLVDGLGDRDDIRVERIGDASVPRMIQTVLLESHQLAMQL